MNYKTKLTLFIKNIHYKIEKKIIYFEIYITKYIFFLFLGFLLGNLFGSFLNIFRKLIIWDGFLILILLLIEEIISYLMYHPIKKALFSTLHYSSFNVIKKKFDDYFFRNSINLTTFHSRKKNTIFFTKKIILIKSLNFFKIGILLGFFVDAFKVGS